MDTRGLASAILIGGMALHAAGAGGAAVPAAATGERRGLSTTFVEVLLEGVPIAHRYVLEMKPIEITNKSDFSMDIQLVALVPQPEELRGGFDPIPDPAWVQFEPKAFTMSPGGRASARLVLYTPDDPALTGRKFVASIFIRGIPVESPAVGVGLKPRLYFTMAGRDDPGLIVKLDTAPKFPKLTPFELGTRAATMRFAAGQFTAENPWGEELMYEIAPDPAALERSGHGGGELLPDMSWVTFRPATVVLAPYASAAVAVEMDVPIDSRHFGRAYVVPIRSVAKRKGSAPVQSFNRVVIVVPDPGKQARGEAD